MPWYMNPTSTCKVLNRIASRHARASLQDLQTVLDLATQRLWHKQAYYYAKRSSNRGN